MQRFLRYCSLVVLTMCLPACMGAMIAMSPKLDDEDVEPNISSDFPYEARYAEVLGSRMHYVEAGEGDPILLIHGNPSSSYLWRNIIPHLKGSGRVIALDLIGMGKSDKPDIDYTYADHARYVDGFIERLELKNLTLLIHDWGSVLGFDYAARHQDNVRGLAFLEGIYRYIPSEEMDFGLRFLLEKLSDPEDNHELAVKENFFIEDMLEVAVGREMSEEEMLHYREPYLKEADRKPIAMWPMQLPFKAPKVREVVMRYEKVLREWEVPKLLLYAQPGLAITAEEVTRAQATLPNLKAVNVGAGMHFVQETQPTAIGRSFVAWYDAEVRAPSAQP